VPTATEPSVVSTTTARDAVQGAVKTLNGYTTNAANAQASNAATSMATNSANKNDASAEQPLSLIDPNTLQTIQFVSPSLNTDNIQSNLAKGYQVEGGAVPTGINLTNYTKLVHQAFRTRIPAMPKL
jgi:hypothetical protein